MATKSIAWATGTGNITLSYTGQGNDTVTVSSDPNNLYVERSQTISFTTTAGSPTVTRQVTVIQAMKEPNFITNDGKWVVTSDDKYLTVQ